MFRLRFESERTIHTHWITLDDRIQLQQFFGGFFLDTINRIQFPKDGNFTILAESR